MLKKLLFILVGLEILFLCSIKQLYAFEYFSDDFEFRDNSKWNFLDNGGQISFENGILNLSSTNPYFPYITNSSGVLLSYIENSVLEIKFNYKALNYMGNGVGVGYTGQNGYPYYQFSVWNDLTNGPVLQYQDDNVLLGGKCDYTRGLKKISLSDIYANSWHVMKIKRNGSSYLIYIDDKLILNTPDNQCIPKNIFIGNPLTGGRTWWTKLSIDYAKVYDRSLSNKIIVLPGLGASWNPQAIFLGNTSPSYQWSMTPFVKNYDLLVSAFEKNGLVKNQDFYVWNYDWRKPLSEIVNDFNIFVNGINLGVNQKVDLVGHSLGGLVARIWTQDHNDLVNKTITLGSPHYGAINAYEAWNGAKVGNNFDAASVALNVLLQLQKKNGDTSVQSLRNFAPIVFDLSPTFTFLKKNGSNLLNKYSQYLGQKNNSVSNSVSKLLTVDGYGENSKEWINLNDRSLFDKVLGIWEDGRPVSYLYGVGDGTVLKKSALISGSETNEFLSNHGDLVDKSVNWVIQKLGLGITVNIPSYPNNKKAIFYSNSNGVMKVNCNGTEQNENNGWIIFDNLDSNGCQINLVGDIDMGKYNLVVGDVNGWRYFLGDIGINEQVSLVVDSVDSYWLSLKNDFIELGVNSAMMAINQKNILKVIDEYIKFRQMTKNFKLSEEILNNIRLILDKKVVSNTEINTMYLKVLASKSLVETNLRLVSRNNIVPRYADALNYEQANILMEFGKNYAANYLANKLYGIVWK